LPGAWQPDRHTDYVAAAQAAVLYRLASRDLMPLHAAPRVARQAAYPRPIAHGLNTLGLACRALLKQRPPGAPQRMQSMSTPSRRVAYPGETIRIEMRLEGPRVRFRALALKRGVVVLDRGICHGPAPDAVQRQEECRPP
jgi:acyl dehydratase